MSKTLELHHPDLGLCAQEVIRGEINESRIKDTWKKKYGKSKYGECTTRVVDNKKDKI